MNGSQLSDEQTEELISAARTAVGDELRSIVYFTDETVEQLYLRDDLDRAADLLGFAENERMGFRSQLVYDETQLGEYRFTIRGFEHGYLTRVIHDHHGAWVTTGSMAIDRFEEVASALATLLKKYS